MAKKRDEFDLDDDDLDLGGDFDDAFGEFDAEMGDHKKRNPIARLGGKFLGGIKDTVFSKPFQKEMISKNLPDGYSTAFDTVDQTIMAGASAVIHPGGSVRDAEVIDAANEHGMAMVFTGMRHFRH